MAPYRAGGGVKHASQAFPDQSLFWADHLTSGPTNRPNRGLANWQGCDRQPAGNHRDPNAGKAPDLPQAPFRRRRRQ